MIKNKQNFIHKGNYTLLKMIILLIVSVIASFIVEYLVFKSLYTFISIDRIVIMIGIILFFGMHFIFEIKKIYYYIYRLRYLLALLFLGITMIFGYSGSSITMYDSYIQGDVTQQSFKPILGKARYIRSDEWAVNTPLIFSQSNVQGKEYPYFNMNIRGTNTDMFTIINAPVKDIVSIGKPFNLGYILFGNSVGLSFWWYGRLVALLLISFEFCMLLTKKNKLVSLLGMLMITFAPATQWWYSNFIADILIFGLLALLLMDKYMTSKKNYIKYLCILGIGFCAVSYVFIFYPAWMISFGYVFLALLIWIILKNKKEYKFDKKDLIAMGFVIILIASIFIKYYTTSKDALSAVLNTDYPGDRIETGGGAQNTLFSYFYEFMFPYKDAPNPCDMSSMLSFFPLPFIIAFVFLIKKSKHNKQHMKFLLPMLIISALLSAWVLVELPEVIGKITLLSTVTPTRAAVPLSFTSVVVLIYLLSNIKEKDKILGKVPSLILMILFVAIVTMVAYYTAPIGYITKKIFVVGLGILILVSYLICKMNKPMLRKILIYVLLMITIIAGVPINPMVKGIDVLYEKPLAKGIQQIVSKDSEALWLVDGLNFTIPNYVIANGARVINSTNYYPNKDLYIKLFGEEVAKTPNMKSVYNRYAHINIEITQEESKIELKYLDATNLYININKLKQLQVKYILTTKQLEQFNTEDITFNNIYNEKDYLIYKVE